jgi:transposase
LKIVVASQPVDFRKGINSLAALVSQALNANPYCGDVFIFRSKRMDRLKLLAWDGTGMVLMTKWLEESRFIWPPIRDGAFICRRPKWRCWSMDWIGPAHRQMS